jgi:hypothetical protein
MNVVNWALAWIAGAGAIGGALNALATDNLHLWPSQDAGAGGRRLVRPGLAGNVMSGMGLSACTFCLLVGSGCAQWTNADDALLPIVVGVALGAIGARSITNESDKRFLRAAVSKAAAAPAADPGTIREMELLPPYAVLKTATALEPRRAVMR